MNNTRIKPIQKSSSLNKISYTNFVAPLYIFSAFYVSIIWERELKSSREGDGIGENIVIKWS